VRGGNPQALERLDQLGVVRRSIDYGGYRLLTVDDRALPAPDAPADAAGEDGYVAPRNPVEERLAAVWAEILRLPQVGVHDNFFRLGGDSILSIRVVSRAREAGLGLSLYQMFERQTVAELAAAAAILDPSLGPARDDMDELMTELEGMSEGELDALLAEIPRDEE